MGYSFGMGRREWLFGLLISSVHGGQHVFLRLLPPLIPILVVDLNATLWQLGLLVSVYLFAGGLFQAPLGILSDRTDRLHLLVPAFVAMSVGYLILLAAPTAGAALPAFTLRGEAFTGEFQVMALGMFVAGIGYSAVHPVGYPLITRNVTADNRGKVLGMWGSASKLGDASAPLLVGVFILVLPWEGILLGISLLGLVYAAGLFALFRYGGYETEPADTGPDEEAPSDAVAEWRRNPREFLFPIAVVVVFFFFILFTGNGIQTFTPVFVADVYGYSFSLAGVTLRPESVANFYFAVLLVSGAVSQILTGTLSDLYDPRSVLLGLLAASTLGLLVLSLVRLTPVTLLVTFALLGSCLFGVNPVRDTLITDITPPEYEGRTFGYVWTIALVGSSGYPVLIGYLGDTIGIQSSFAYLALGTFGAMAAIGILYSSRVYRAPSTVEPDV
ncbi:MFS transporter [Halorarum salinum]|uniref:MFS transporter n=1 Tax=Halorarum salinum TaxID=2743089 RepID=A0A7D5LCC7_9EURY|nr:MFS transporter [Halobaculum salinum]QLG63392.1 MFS transporter [Halobaculum salinum]